MVRASAVKALRTPVEIEHVAAAIEFELGAFLAVDRRQMVEHIAAHRVGRDHVAIAMGDHQMERRRQRQQHAQIVGDARLAVARVAFPVPFAGNIGREQIVGDIGLEAELVARVSDEGAAVGTHDAVEDRIGPRAVGDSG